jgi:hypothetical protein
MTMAGTSARRPIPYHLHMVRALLTVVVPAALAAACIVPPGDRQQIRDLVRDRQAALVRGDTVALYRMHDLDFRAVCPLERFRLPPAEPASVPAIRAIEIRGSRAWATIDQPNHDRAERLALVKDAGRWYLYDDADACPRPPTRR